MPEEIEGVIERITFHNPENGFSVIRIRIPGSVATVVGYAASVTEGERVRAIGLWKDDARHGRQFAAESISPMLAQGRAQIEAYFASGVIKGIGPSTAKLLWTHFKEKVFEVMDETPERLLELPGIGPKRVRMITASWGEQRSMRELVTFLAESGIGPQRAARIQKQYGPDAVRLITENPYRLVHEVRGIGFTTADQLALRLGLARDAPERLRAGVRHALDQTTLQGHCGVPLEDLVSSAAALLGVGMDAARSAIEYEIGGSRLSYSTLEGVPAVFARRLFLAEHDIALAFRYLVQGVPPWRVVSIESALEWVEGRTGLKLAASQRSAIETVLKSKVAVVTGGPGVGKTTLVNSILQILEERDVNVLLAAPTGRASRRLTESTGREAKTIHRLLEISPESGDFARGRDNPLDCDLLVVDEASMVDVVLMQAIVLALPAHAALLLVGDVDQLPAVGPGQVLGDIIRSGTVPTVRLEEVFRQAAESRIIVNAHAINSGERPDLTNRDAVSSDFFFVRASPERVVERIVNLVSERIPRRFGLDPLRDVQVLSPMRKSSAGVEPLNSALQRVLNPSALDPHSPRIERMGTSFHKGDKVMQTVNDYDKDVFNGDVGIIRELDGEEGTALIDFEGREIEVEEGDFDDLVLSYATTIHKSQGSEYPAVVIALTRQHAIMLQRNLLYTAVTRGRKLVVLVGEEEAIGRAVESRNVRRRWTKLREWLTDGTAG